MKKIIFVSEMKIGSEKATSTDIMTDNLIAGLKKTGYPIEIIAICEEPRYKASIKHYYKDHVGGIHFVDSVFDKYRNGHTHLFRLLKNTVLKRKYAERIPTNIDYSEAILIAHAPSLESVFLCSQIVRENPQVKLYQYWSDPVALSGIIPEQYSYKRWPFRWVESQALKYAEKVIYGTKVLMDHQKNMFPKYAHKMDYIDVSYKSAEPAQVVQPTLSGNIFLYAGGFKSSVRNIKPLFNAVEHMDNVFLDVYGEGDVFPNSSQKVRVHGWISPQKMSETELKYRNVICLMNSSCVQIPGKTFYGTNLPQNILIVLDGAYAGEIKAYLQTYERFHFCYNTESSIKDALEKLLEVEPYVSETIDNYSPEHISASLLSKINQGYEQADEHCWN